MVAAFEALGYQVCDVIENYEMFRKEWEHIFDHGATAEDFRRMYENVDVITDTPGCHFWEEILEAFPECKLVLTQRRNEHEWVKSLQNQFAVNSTIFMHFIILFSPVARGFRSFMDKLSVATMGTKIHRPWFGKATINEMVCRQRYRQHNAYIQQKAPRDQLLVYDFKQGWEPLCKFLGKPIPKQPFPHENKKGGVTEKFMKQKPLVIRMRNEMIAVSTFLGALFIGGLAYIVFQFW